MAKFRCGGCKEYFDQAEAVKSNGVQRFCSNECAYRKSINSAPPKPFGPKKKKADIPDTIRKAVLKRDKNRCRFCRTKDGLHLHHIVYRSQGGEHVEHNLITLCHRHHALIHSDKKKYMPLCLGVLWLSIVEHKHLTIPQLGRFLDHAEASDEVR